MDQEIYTAIAKAICRRKNLALTSISQDSTLAELNISSLDAITIVYDVEDLFDIEVSNEELENLKNVQDIVDGITRLVQSKG